MSVVWHAAMQVHEYHKNSFTRAAHINIIEYANQNEAPKNG